MARFFLLFFLLLELIYAEGISASKHARLVQKGEKVALKLCDPKKLDQIKHKELDLILRDIGHIQPCTALNSRNKEALAYFIMAGHSENITRSKGQIEVPEEAKCPVCGMFVSKYPKWASLVEEGTTKHYFDGVKDMMKFYIFDADFPYNRTSIRNITVTDFYTLDAIDAKQAFYVLGSDVYGPMGNELIPFLTQKAAQNFMADHKGKKIIRFHDITPGIVMKLDGIRL